MFMVPGPIQGGDKLLQLHFFKLLFISIFPDRTKPTVISRAAVNHLKALPKDR